MLGVLVLIPWVYNINCLGLLFASQTWFIIMLTMAQHGIVIGIISICKSMIVDHVYFNVYNISPLDLILFPWGLSINRFILLFLWVSHINPKSLLFPWVYNIDHGKPWLIIPF